MKIGTVGIVGANGFVGRNLSDFLNNSRVKTKLLFHSSRKKQRVGNIYFGDVISGVGLTSFLKDCDVVINLIGRYSGTFEEQLESNVLALDKLSKACIENKIEKIVHISAAAAIGNPPDTLYGLSKKMGEELAFYYHKKYGVKFVILRPPNIYGPGNVHGVVFDFLKSISEKNSVTIGGDGRQERDYLFVFDLVDAIYKSLKLDFQFELLNITSGEVLNLLELVKKMEKVLNKKVKIFYKGEAYGPRVIKGDNSVAKRKLKWKPKIDLAKGILLTLSSLK